MVTYLEKPLCQKHWGAVADDSYRRSNAVLRKLKLPTRVPYKPKPTKAPSKPKQAEEPVDVCVVCRKPVGQSRLCKGCEYYVCEGCNAFDPTGNHELDDHLNSGDVG